MIKCTALFNSVSNLSAASGAQTRTGGWSESVYNTGNAAAARDLFLAFCQLRARILPKGFAIVGQRFQEVDGQSSTLGRRFPGNPAYEADIPQMGLQIKGQASGAINVRRWTFRGIPDIMVTEGEYLPTPQFKTMAENAAKFLGGSTWRFFAKDLSQTLYDVASITTAGLMTLALETPFDAGMEVQLFRCKDESGRGVNGRFLCLQNAGVTQTQLSNYKKAAVVSGQVRRVQYFPYGIDASTIAVEKCVVRKVGRPFGGYSGRHGRRK